MQEEAALKAAGPVPVEVEQHVTHFFLLVESELEANVEGLGCESEAVAFVGVEDVGVVDESGRSDEHECELFADVGVGVISKLEVSGFFIYFRLLRRQLRLLSHFLQR